MATQRYKLERDGEKRLEISSGAFWKQVVVRLDGTEIGTMSGRKELAAGRDFPLPDGSTLNIQLRNSLVLPELQVLRNGQPLPGSASDPEVRLKNAYGIVYFVSALNLLLGSAAGAFKVAFLQQIGFGWSTVLIGVVFLALGVLIQRRSRAALAIAMGLYGLDGILMILTGFTAGVIAHIYFLIAMGRGWSATRVRS